MSALALRAGARLTPWRLWRPAAIDRYIFRHAALRLVATVAIVVIVMTLENAPRLVADLRHADAPGALLARLSAYLVPEHLAIGLPVGLFVAVALTARSLAGRGEWQMLAAAGMSPARIMAAPTLLAVLVGGLLLGNALSLRPAGERQLDALYMEVIAGGHGVAVPLREPVSLADGAVLVADGAGATPGELSGVTVRRGGSIMTAGRARVAGDGHGGVALLLGQGTTIETRVDGTTRRVHFDQLALRGDGPATLAMAPGNLRHRLDRLGGAGLWSLATHADAPALRDAALAALLARVEAAVFCVLLPWLAVALGVPPRRRAGGPAMIVGILLIVLHLEGAALVEDGLSAHAVAATLAHAAPWTAIVAGIARQVARAGEGAVDLLIAQGVARARAGLTVVAPLPALRRLAAAIARALEPPSGGGGLPALRPVLPLR